MPMNIITSLGEFSLNVEIDIWAEEGEIKEII